MVKDTSIRLTITLHVSMLKPSVLMSLPVRRTHEVQMWTKEKPEHLNGKDTYVCQQSCSWWFGAPPQRSPCPETQSTHLNLASITPSPGDHTTQLQTYVPCQFGEETSESCIHVLIWYCLLNSYHDNRHISCSAFTLVPHRPQKTHSHHPAQRWRGRHKAWWEIPRLETLSRVTKRLFFPKQVTSSPTYTMQVSKPPLNTKLTQTGAGKTGSAKTHQFSQHQSLTGCLSASRRTLGCRSLRSGVAQRWKGWSGTLQGGAWSESTPPAGWWRFRTWLSGRGSGRSSCPGVLHADLWTGGRSQHRLCMSHIHETTSTSSAHRSKILVTTRGSGNLTGHTCLSTLQNKNKWSGFIYCYLKQVTFDSGECHLLPALEPKKKKHRRRLARVKDQLIRLHFLSTYLVNGESDGVHVLALFSELPAVLLNQANHKAASIFSIIWVIILLLQVYHKLRVHPERVCRSSVRVNGQGKQQAS